MSKTDNLARLVERFGSLGPLDDEHHRYALYLTALDYRELWPLLLDCLADEQDTSMATSVVVAALERVEPRDRPTWAAAVSRTSADDGSIEISAFLIRRLAELEVLDRVTADPAAVEGVADRLNELSPTFEHRVVERSTSREVLAALASKGTRRTRHHARERLRELGGADAAQGPPPNGRA
jgi:hypothetical protein